MRLLRPLAFAAVLGALSTPALADEDRSPAPGFTLDTLDGESVSLDDFEGQVVAVSFWATWCRPCLQELPHMSRFHETYGDVDGDGERDFTVLAISTDGPETLAEVRQTARRQRWAMQVLLDQEGDVSAQLNPRGTNPFTVFIDRNGNIAHSHEGYSSGDEDGYETLIQELIAEGGDHAGDEAAAE